IFMAVLLERQRLSVDYRRSRHPRVRWLMTMDSLITGVAHIGIRVHDLRRSRAFYEKLGFRFVAGPLGPEPVAIMSHPSGIEVNFILNAASEDQPNVLMDVPDKH